MTLHDLAFFLLLSALSFAALRVARAMVVKLIAKAKE